MIDISEIKELIGLVDQDEYDEILTSMEAEAVDYMENRTGWYLGPIKQFVEYHSGEHGRKSILLENEATPVTKIEFRENTLSVNWVDKDLTGFLVIRRRVENLSSLFPVGTNNVRITYKTGFKSGDEPPIARRSVKELVEQWFHERVTATSGSAVRPSQESIQVPRTVQTAIGSMRRIYGT